MFIFPAAVTCPGPINGMLPEKNARVLSAWGFPCGSDTGFSKRHPRPGRGDLKWLRSSGAALRRFRSSTFSVSGFCLLSCYALDELFRRFIPIILLHQPPHYRQLQNGLLELIDALFGGKQRIEVLGQECPVVGQLGGVGGLG